MTCVMCQRPWTSSILVADDINYFFLPKSTDENCELRIEETIKLVSG